MAEISPFPSQSTEAAEDPHLGSLSKSIKFVTCLKARLVGEMSSDSTSALSVTDSSGVVIDTVLCSH